MDNLFDPYGKANISTLLLKFISHDPSTHCGINFSKLVNSPFASSDGSSWTARTIPTGNWASVTYGNGVFVAVADGVGSTTASIGRSERYLILHFGILLPMETVSS